MLLRRRHACLRSPFAIGTLLCSDPFRSVPCVLLPALPDRMAKCVDRVARPLGCLIARVQNIEPL